MTMSTVIQLMILMSYLHAMIHITGNPIELTLNISTLGPLQINTVSKVNVTLFKYVCRELPLTYINGDL